MLNNNFYNHASKRQITICTVARKIKEFWVELEKYLSMVMANQNVVKKNRQKNKAGRESRKKIKELEQTREVKIKEKFKINRKGGIL